MTRGLEQPSQLLGDWVAESKNYSEGRGQTKVAPAEGGAWEFSVDGIKWKVDFDLTYTKVRG